MLRCLSNREGRIEEWKGENNDGEAGRGYLAEVVVYVHRNSKGKRATGQGGFMEVSFLSMVYVSACRMERTLCCIDSGGLPSG